MKTKDKLQQKYVEEVAAFVDFMKSSLENFETDNKLLNKRIVNTNKKLINSPAKMKY